MRTVLLALSVAGVVLFGGSFALSYLNPLLVERAAREIVRMEVEDRVGEKIDQLSDARLTALAQRALKKTDAEIAQLRAEIRAEVPSKVANVVANMLDPACACRQHWAESLQKAKKENLWNLTQLQQRLTGLIETAYASVATNLMREFRIFTASNAVAFALLGVLTLFRGRAVLQLILPAIVLVGAVVLTGGLYLFNQNWLHTIVFGEYVGMGYVLYLGGVALMFSDVVFNRARATTQMVNLVFSVIGAAVTAVAC